MTMAYKMIMVNKTMVTSFTDVRTFD